jgi:hypothetical protein
MQVTATQDKLHARPMQRQQKQQDQHPLTARKGLLLALKQQMSGRWSAAMLRQL